MPTLLNLRITLTRLPEPLTEGRLLRSQEWPSLLHPRAERAYDISHSYNTKRKTGAWHALRRYRKLRRLAEDLPGRHSRIGRARNLHRTCKDLRYHGRNTDEVESVSVCLWYCLWWLRY
jgi:hypothetical protein